MKPDGNIIALLLVYLIYRREKEVLMPYSPEQLIKIAASYEQSTIKSLVVTAKKKDKKKLDPKAKVRNRGTVCVPAEQAKDKKDHFPINDEGQARNALARVQQLSSAPWYKGSLEGLKALVSRKVKAKYPKIDVGGKKKEKKSSIEISDKLFSKYGQEAKAPKGTPGNPYTAEELGNDVIELDDVPPTQPQAKPQQQQQRPQQPANPAIVALQQALDKLGFKGKDGKTLIGRNNQYDGILGPNTQFALDAYKAKNKDRLIYNNGQPMDDGLVQEVVKRDASGQNAGQTPVTFNYEAMSDGLSKAVGYLTRYQEQSKNQSITPQTVTTVKQHITQLQEYVTGVAKAIADKATNGNADEKKQAAELDPIAKKLLADISGDKGWLPYLASFPTATMGTASASSKLERLLNKYAQMPMDPRWVGTTAQQTAPQAQPQAQKQQTPSAQPQAQPQAQQAQPQAQQGQGQPQAQQAQPQAQQQAPARKISDAQVKQWNGWLESESKKTQRMIEGGGSFLGIGGYGGIKDFKDKDNFPGAKLEEFKANFEDNLQRIEKGKASGLEGQLDEEHRNMLFATVSRTKILIKHIDREIQRRERAEDREDYETDHPQQPRSRWNRSPWMNRRSMTPPRIS